MWDVGLQSNSSLYGSEQHQSTVHQLLLKVGRLAIRCESLCAMLVCKAISCIALRLVNKHHQPFCLSTSPALAHELNTGVAISDPPLDFNEPSGPLQCRLLKHSLALLGCLGADHTLGASANLPGHPPFRTTCSGTRAQEASAPHARCCRLPLGRAPRSCEAPGCQLANSENPKTAPARAPSA